jgi:hypothetical protein
MSTIATKATSLTFAFSVVALLVGAGCDGDKPAGSCDWRSASGDRCFDYPKSEVTSGKGICASGRTWSDKGCDRTGSIGGCKTTAGITKWIYPTAAIKTREDAKSECMTDWLGPDGKPVK